MQNYGNQMTANEVDSIFLKKLKKNQYFSRLMVLLILGSIFLFTVERYWSAVSIFLISLLCLLAALNNIQKIKQHRKSLKENPEHYKNEQGEFTLANIDLLLGSLFFL